MMKRELNMGVSPITYQIYAGRSKPDPKNPKYMMWVGAKTDVTDEAIRAVFEHMWLQAEKTGAFEIKFPGYGTMTLVRKKEVVK
jgi:hypothetical protein